MSFLPSKVANQVSHTPGRKQKQSFRKHIVASSIFVFQTRAKEVETDELSGSKWLKCRRARLRLKHHF